MLEFIEEKGYTLVNNQFKFFKKSGAVYQTKPKFFKYENYDELAPFFTPQELTILQLKFGPIKYPTFYDTLMNIEPIQFQWKNIDDDNK